MRLFTHNFLQCHVRSCTKNNFPLKFQEDAEVQIKAAEFNADFLAVQMCKIDYNALLDVLKEVRAWSHLFTITNGRFNFYIIKNYCIELYILLYKLSAQN